MTLTHWPSLHADRFRGWTVCVTGGAGFIGSHLVDALLALGAHVRVIDDLCRGDESNLARARAGDARDKLRFHHASVLDPQALESAFAGCRTVFHLAALGSVPRSVEQPELYLRVNVGGAFRVLQAARAAGVERVLFASSSSVYGGAEELPQRETLPIRARSPYAATKAACESLFCAWAGAYALDTASLRFFNVFGPRQNAHSAYAAVIAAFAKAMLAGERPVIHGDGEQSRDFTYVDNVVHANLLAARCAQPLAGRSLNVACGDRVTVNQLAQAVARVLGRADLTPIHAPSRAGDVRHSQADLSAIRSALGYAPIVSLEPALRATLDWYAEVLAPQPG
jgi:nucleoside-diphosphate-sugar epimerase